jgi:hypothetical protein
MYYFEGRWGNNMKYFVVAVMTMMLFAATSNSVNAFWPFDKDVEPTSQTEFPPLIQKIMGKFGLNKDEVTTVMNEYREEHHNQVEARFQERLSSLVADGKLTNEQKTQLEAKHEEMEANHEELRNISGPEKREAMVAYHEEIQTWAEAKGIDIDQIMPMGGGLGKGGMHRGMSGRN